MRQEDLETILTSVFNEHSLIYAVFSSPKQADESQKVTVRPLLIKGNLVYQVTDFCHHQARHQNFSKEESQNMFRERLNSFKQAVLYTSKADYQILSNKRAHVTILKKPPTKSAVPILLSHNRSKQYVLKEGIPVPFLIELGIMNREGKVYPKKNDKFRQVNRFLEMVEDVISYLDPKHKIHVIDFGCGKAYLTFALYYYLKVIKGYDLHLIGLDLKQDVINKCQSLAMKLGYKDLQFAIKDINDYQNQNPIDMVISLHACDTATDAALEKAVRWQAKVILCAPCCQHELSQQIQQESLAPLLKHGILKERFAALATDAVRAQLLDVLGYQTQILEFIDIEHTPKNLLIRAIRRNQAELSKEAWQNYLNFKKSLQIDPSLERRFRTWFT